jgi:translation initiation factor IF-2
MLTFLTGLWANPLARKCILYGAATLAILFALRLYSNRVWEQGVQAGKIQATQEVEKAKEVEWKAKEDALAVAGAKLATDQRTLSAQTAELARARSALQDSLSRSLNQIRASHEANNAKVIAVPADQLDAALRNLSAELAAGAAH